VFLGPPGAGKGTQGPRLAGYFQILHIATGDMLRRAVEQGSEVGLRVKVLMEHGELVPDILTNELVRVEISRAEAGKGFVLDGYPRNQPQAEALTIALDEMGACLDGVLRFMVKGDELVARLSGRRICPACKAVYQVQTRPPKTPGICDKDSVALVQRDDDKPDSILRRLEVYGQKTKPLFDFYQELGLLKDIDAMGTTDEVFERILAAVK